MARISLSENGREGGENNKTLILNKVFIYSFIKIKECKNFFFAKKSEMCARRKSFFFSNSNSNSNGSGRLTGEFFTKKGVV